MDRQNASFSSIMWAYRQFIHRLRVEGSEMKIEYRNRRSNSDRSFTVETELDHWLGRILWLGVATVVLIVLWALGVDPSRLLMP
jgi:hypothetical protein